MLQRKPAEDRKTDIVEALLRLADQIGPDRLTTNDIAREVGVTQAAIFRHFPTKAELWSAVGEVIAVRLAEAWQQALAANTTPKDRLRALIAAQLRQIEATPALPAILHSREINVDNVILRERFRGLMMQYQAHLVANLEGMIADGSMTPDVRPQDAAVLLTSLVQGIAIRWSLGSRGFALQPEGLRLLDVQLALFAYGERQR
ncbi:TetR/AcrR family transcriptional regulator [Pseudothioclava nitratireducens]|jgi:AcrR family transcriptional regulator|uniref:TetR/AcrR family transcriptional regulator n=1 Tax=Pseudothioclava nitratireducens TaxID=1928646 RepID=UPI0008BBB8B9|nr:TetR/AcrR family transcriptional regulator [Defluviimonas nitratireducens]MDF1621217.1 TetR/AcrR family transcriptional regulator [Defluviimonas nitratireducens]OGA95801.1 MAG: TetR family transcriptional regulator [Burkholderiales bacterium RIFCSPHIGHO2_12_63_9]OHC52712.1 MAG: TetR family transcriptional regulator [Rhodobacterales bacterium RIFCSPHIGHO2_02_FULL_62_130]